MGDIVSAPWTPEQVDSLNGYQYSGVMHPFTCGNCRDNDEQLFLIDERILVATQDGWICETCDYTQDWAHDFMADGQWRGLVQVMDTLFGDREEEDGDG